MSAAEASTTDRFRRRAEVRGDGSDRFAELDTGHRRARATSRAAGCCPNLNEHCHVAHCLPFLA